MKKNRVIKPGKWWIVRFRLLKSFEEGVVGFLNCKNAHRAGHSGFERKPRIVYVKGRKTRRLTTRKWHLAKPSERRLAYKFAELKDLKASIRSKLIRDWMIAWNGILEIVECEGCRYYGTVTSEKVVERRFNTTNEMEILAVECALGED